MATTRSVTRKNRQAELDDNALKIASNMIDFVSKGIQQRELQAEQRVRLFLTLGAGSIGFLSWLRGIAAFQQLDWSAITICVLAILLLFGLETVQSLNWKHIYTRVDRKLCNSLPSSMACTYPFVHRYTDIVHEADKLQDMPSNWPFNLPAHRIRGSLAEFMYAANGLLVSGILMALIWGIGAFLTISSCVVAFLGSIAIQYKYSKKTRDRIPITWVENVPA